MIHMADKIDDSKYLWTDKTDDGHTRIGLNDLAWNEIGQVTFAEFPEKLTQVEDGDPILSFEGAKAVTEIHTPVAGKVPGLTPIWSNILELLNEDNRDKTWIVELF